MKKLLLFSLLTVLLLSGCHVSEDLNVEPVQSSEQKAVTSEVGVSGRLLSIKGKPLTGTTVSLAQVYRQKGKAAFVLDSGNSPSAITDKKGSFSFKNIPAGEYILVIGNTMSSYHIYSMTEGEPEVFVVEPGKDLKIGTLKIVSPK